MSVSRTVAQTRMRTSTQRSGPTPDLSTARLGHFRLLLIVLETGVSIQEKLGGPGRDRTDDLFHAMERRKSQLADGKGFDSRTSRQKPLKSACFATKMLPKHVLPICYQTGFGPRG